MSTGSNTHWAALIVDELVRCGCDSFIISPGSRSTPLVVAAARHPRARCRVCLDERGAAFHGLGAARRSWRPAVLICTSGTALANYLPAIVEADLDGVPLLVLSADRPPELRDTGANQTIEQRGIFGQSLRWHSDLPVPSARVDPRVVLTTVDQAVHRATGTPPGPVQINCPFAEPLEPEPLPAELLPGVAAERWGATTQPFTRYAGASGAIDDQLAGRLIAAFGAVERGLLVAGSLPPAAAAPVAALGARLGWPILGDVTSGVAGTAGLQLLLQTAAGRELLRPDAVLHFGGRVVNKQYLQLLGEYAPRLWQVAARPQRLDPSHSVELRLVAEPGAVAAALDSALAPNATGGPAHVAQPNSHAEQVRQAAARAHQAARAWLGQQRSLTEPAVACAVAGIARRPLALYVASSMPVRDVDTFAQPLAADLPVAANRGASGIDGSIATAIGFAGAGDGPLVALLGDLAFIHDLSSLSQLQDHDGCGVALVVVNNRGGGIFSLLPIAAPGRLQAGEFERLFGTPHDVDLAAVAQAFGLRHHAPDTAAQLNAALDAAVEQAAGGDSSLIEVRTERDANRVVHEQVRAAVAAAVRRQ